MSSLFDYMTFCSHAVTHKIVVILGTFYFYFHVKRKCVTLVELTWKNIERAFSAYSGNIQN